MSRQSAPARRANRFRPTFDTLEGRVVPTVTITMITDPVTGMTDLRIIGDGRAQNITVTDNGNGSVGISTGTERTIIKNQFNMVIAVAPGGVSGTGTVNNGFFTNVAALDFRLGLGNDTLTYNLTAWNANSPNRSISVDMGAGNDVFALDATTANTPSITNATLTVNYVGGTGNDTLSEMFGPINNSKITLSSDAGFGADTATIDFTGTINGATQGSTIVNNLAMNQGNDSVTINVENTGAANNIDQGSSVTNSVDLGGGSNTLTYSEGNSILANSTVNLNIAGGAQTDIAAVALNNTVINTGHFNLKGDLSCGNDSFNASYGSGFTITGAGANASIDMNGNQGNDTLGVSATATGATIAGLFDINLQGGTGNDAITTTTLTAAAGALNLNAGGNYRLRIDGGDGSDTISTTLSNTAGSAGNYDIAINGGNSGDTVSFGIDNLADGAVTFNPDNEIVLDGGPPVPTPPFTSPANNMLRLHNPNMAPIVIRNFATVVNF